MSSIELKGLFKTFGDFTAVHPTDLRVEHGELVTLLGPSGSGKSTILSMIAGLLEPTGGRVLIGERDVTDVPPALRNLGVVFQSYALFPHLTVYENIAFPLVIRKLPKADIETAVHRALDMVRLKGLADRRQAQLSGGQQQRVALARALVFKPEILLLDEPMGALDKKLREEVQLELRHLQRNLGVTTILVTHDQEEALSLSTRLVVLSDGRVQQVGTPMDAYRFPKNRFVAEFLGSANLWTGEAGATADGAYVLLPTGERLNCQSRADVRGKAHLLVRPESLQVHAADAEDGIAAEVTEVVYLGGTTRVHMKTRTGAAAIAHGTRGDALSEGQPVIIRWDPQDAWLIPAE